MTAKATERTRFFAGAREGSGVVAPQVRAVGDREAEIFIYDVIGARSFFDEGNPTEDLVREIADLDVDTITVRINSPGGVVFDGIAIFNALRAHKAKIITQIDGLAASIASVVAMAGEERRIMTGSMFMIHDPMTIALGNKRDMREVADMLEKVGDSITDIYATGSELSRKEIVKAMEAETWYSADEAIDAGFVTEKFDGAKVEDSSTFNLTDIFDNVPDDLRSDPTVRDVERGLRSSGLTRRESERVAAIWQNSPVQGDPEPGEQGDPVSVSDDIDAAIDALKDMTKERS